MFAQPFILVVGNTSTADALADLTAFAEDPVDCDADDLPDLPVLLTVVDGQVVHRAG